MKRIICTLAILFCFSSTASPDESKQLSPEEVGAVALSKVKLDWRPAGWMIEFRCGIEGYLGMSFEAPKKIFVWIRPEHSSAQVAGTLVHEFAHVFDWLYMTDEMHAEWLRARNLPADTLWFPSCRGCSDYIFGAGDFAESVARTFQGPGIEFRGKLGPPPNEEQQQLIRRWFSQVAGK
jgi:hypothetical protein